MIIKTKPIFAINNPPDSNSLGSIPYVFFMSESPISNAIYCEYLNANYKKQKYLTQIPEGITKLNNKFIINTKLEGHYPLTNINFFQMQSFIYWLNTIDKTKSYYLPSLDEWYKAAYYDPVSKKYYNYPNRTDTIDRLSKHIADQHSMNTENIIGGKTKNKYYIHNYSFFDVRDMGGNIYETTQTAGNQCIIVGSSWNRNRLNAHKYNCGSRSVSKRYNSKYIGFRLCRKCPSQKLFLSLHNDLGNGWNNDTISIYDTNNGVLLNNITLNNGYKSDFIPFDFFDYTDKLLIFNYNSTNNLFPYNSVRIYNQNKKNIYKYTFKKQNDKILINLSELM